MLLKCELEVALSCNISSHFGPIKMKSVVSSSDSMANFTLETGCHAAEISYLFHVVHFIHLLFAPGSVPFWSLLPSVSTCTTLCATLYRTDNLPAFFNSIFPISFSSLSSHFVCGSRWRIYIPETSTGKPSEAGAGPALAFALAVLSHPLPPHAGALSTRSETQKSCSRDEIPRNPG